MPLSSEQKDEFVENRYTEAIAYYWKTSRNNKRAYKLTRSLTVILGAMVTLVASLSLLYVDARRAERELEEEVRTTREVNAFLRDTLSLADPKVSGVAELNMHELLDRTADRIEAELSRNTRVAAEVRATVGEAYAGRLGIVKIKGRIAVEPATRHGVEI